MLQRIVIDANWLRNTNNYAKLCRSCASNETQLIHFSLWRLENGCGRRVKNEFNPFRFRMLKTTAKKTLREILILVPETGFGNFGARLLQSRKTTDP